MSVLTAKRGIRACYGFDRGDFATTYDGEKLEIDHIAMEGSEETITSVTVYTRDGRELDWTAIESYEKDDPAADFAIQVFGTERQENGSFVYEFGSFMWDIPPARDVLSHIEKAIGGKVIRTVMPEGTMYFDKKIPNREVIEKAYRSIILDENSE